MPGVDQVQLRLIRLLSASTPKGADARGGQGVDADLASRERCRKEKN